VDGAVAREGALQISVTSDPVGEASPIAI
jgi:hypothetical protein